MHGRCNGIEMCSRPVGENDRLTLVRRFFGQTKFETEKSDVPVHFGTEKKWSKNVFYQTVG